MDTREEVIEGLTKIYGRLEDINSGYLFYTMAFVIYDGETKKYNIMSNQYMYDQKEVILGLMDRCEQLINKHAVSPFDEEIVVRGDLRETLKGTKYTCMIYAFLVDILNEEYINFAVESGVKNDLKYLLSIVNYIRKDINNH